MATTALTSHMLDNIQHPSVMHKCLDDFANLMADSIRRCVVVFPSWGIRSFATFDGVVFTFGDFMQKHLEVLIELLSNSHLFIRDHRHPPIVLPRMLFLRSCSVLHRSFTRTLPIFFL